MKVRNCGLFLVGLGLFLLFLVCNVKCITVHAATETISTEESIDINGENVAESFKDKTFQLHQVGDVVKSFLTEAEFEAVRGTKWALMDGRALSPTDELRIITGWTNLPDATEKYVIVDNSGSRSPGDILSQTTADPGLVLSDNDVTHSHSYDGDSLVDGGHNAHSYVYAHQTPDALNTGGSGQGAILIPTASSTNTWNHNHDIGGFSCGSDGEASHSHSIPNFDPEMRLNSVGVNYFVKIN